MLETRTNHAIDLAFEVGPLSARLCLHTLRLHGNGLRGFFCDVLYIHSTLAIEQIFLMLVYHLVGAVAELLLLHHHVPCQTQRSSLL